MGRFLGFLAALTVGWLWSLGYLSALGYWLVTGRGPGGRLIASTSGSGAAGRRGLRALLSQEQSGREPRVGIARRRATSRSQRQSPVPSSRRLAQLVA